VDSVHNQTGAETIAGIVHCHGGQIEELPMARTSNRLPKRFPVGSKYVVESHGPVVSRYVEFPNGHKVMLAKRMALTRTPGRARRLCRPQLDRGSISA
jgi:hypothetical protein